MQCPVCDVKLNHAAYEGQTVYHCPECRGHLATRQRVSQIKSSRERSTEALKEEATQQQRADTAERLLCPKCCTNRMIKEKVRVRFAAGESFSIDVCGRCKVVWFDGGELARLQLEHEESPKGHDELRTQQRGQERTPEEQARFQQVLDALPGPEGVARGVGVPAVLLGLAVAVGVLCFLDLLPVWALILAAVVGVAAVVRLAAILMRGG